MLEIKTRGEFCVLGREGSSDDGKDIVQRLWRQANEGFAEIAPMVEQINGKSAELWGAMSDFSRAFLPWQDGFTRGLYLAGAKAKQDAVAPKGWSLWRVPAFEYAVFDGEGDPAAAFGGAIRALADAGLTLAGAAQEFYDIQNGGNVYLYMPIRRLDGAKGCAWL